MAAMGAKALVHFKGGGYHPDKIVATVYVQSGGHPTELGADLKNIFAGAIMRNGLSGKGVEVNGPGCAAATFICAMKLGPGGVYVHESGSSSNAVDYIYTVSGKTDGPMTLRVEGRSAVLFDGPVDDFDTDVAEAKDCDD